MSFFKVKTFTSKEAQTGTMFAVCMHSYGGPEVLRYEEIPRPRAGVGEILIKVHAAGVNPVDWKIREGYLEKMANHTLPLIPGWDFSGVVDSVGPGAERFEEGDEVFGRGLMRSTRSSPASISTPASRSKRRGRASTRSSVRPPQAR